MSRADNYKPLVDVLIAEDDAITRMALRHIFESVGYSCMEASDGERAVEVARMFRPRLVLLDLMMPGIDGFTTAERLRSDPQTRSLPIHCLTGLDFPAARRAAQKVGAQGFLTKPFDPRGVLEFVNAALHGKRNDLVDAG